MLRLLLRFVIAVVMTHHVISSVVLRDISTDHHTFSGGNFITTVSFKQQQNARKARLRQIKEERLGTFKEEVNVLLGRIDWYTVIKQISHARTVSQKLVTTEYEELEMNEMIQFMYDSLPRKQQKRIAILFDLLHTLVKKYMILIWNISTEELHEIAFQIWWDGMKSIIVAHFQMNYWFSTAIFQGDYIQIVL